MYRPLLSGRYVLMHSHRKGAVLGNTHGHAQTACSRYSQPYSLGGSSDAASGYQSTVASCLFIIASHHGDGLANRPMLRVV